MLPFYQIFRIYSSLRTTIQFFFLPFLFFLRLYYRFDKIIIFLKKTMYFPVIPDNAHNLFHVTNFLTS